MLNFEMHKHRDEKPKAAKGKTDTDWDDGIMAEAADAIDKRVTVNRKFDVPYLGGTSSDGRIIYLDKDLPESFQCDGKTCHVDRYLAVHEMVEQALMSGLGLRYQLAHQIALRAERAAVEADGHDWEEYDEFMAGWAEKALAKKEPDAPPDLDRKPYEHEEDEEALERIRPEGEYATPMEAPRVMRKRKKAYRA